MTKQNGTRTIAVRLGAADLALLEAARARASAAAGVEVSTHALAHKLLSEALRRSGAEEGPR